VQSFIPQGIYEIHDLAKTKKKENIGKGLSYSEIILESLFKKSLAIRKIKSLRFWRLFCSYLGNY